MHEATAAVAYSSVTATAGSGARDHSDRDPDAVGVHHRGGQSDAEPVPLHGPRHRSGPSIAEQQRALFVADNGRGMGALDVLDNGVRGSRGRTPILRWTLQNSQLPHFRVVAAMLLAAWGDADALRTIEEWATFPDGTPAVLQAEFQDPFSGCDNAFQLLCHGVGTIIPDEPDAVRQDRLAALRALVAISPVHFVGSAMARAASDLEARWPEIGGVVNDAIHEAFDRLARKAPDECDRALQAAVLVGILSHHREADGAVAARMLLSLRPHERAVRELLTGLGEAAPGRDCTTLLRDLSNDSDSRSVWAREALRHREQAHPAPSEIGRGRRTP